MRTFNLTPLLAGPYPTSRAEGIAACTWTRAKGGCKQEEGKTALGTSWLQDPPIGTLYICKITILLKLPNPYCFCVRVVCACKCDVTLPSKSLRFFNVTRNGHPTTSAHSGLHPTLCLLQGIARAIPPHASLRENAGSHLPLPPGRHLHNARKPLTAYRQRLRAADAGFGAEPEERDIAGPQRCAECPAQSAKGQRLGPGGRRQPTVFGGGGDRAVELAQDVEGAEGYRGALWCGYYTSPENTPRAGGGVGGEVAKKAGMSGWILHGDPAIGALC